MEVLGPHPSLTGKEAAGQSTDAGGTSHDGVVLGVEGAVVLGLDGGVLVAGVLDGVLRPWWAGRSLLTDGESTTASGTAAVAATAHTTTGTMP